MVIPICFTFDDNYAMPAAVAFWSLLDRARPDVAYDMYVLHHDVTEEHRRQLSGIVAKSGRGNLTFINTGDFLQDAWSRGNWDGHQSRQQFTRDTVMKCFPVHFFPNVDRMIYSDVDVVFADDVSELMRVDLGDCYLAAVTAGVFKNDEKRELSHFSAAQLQRMKGKYVAGGIWVLNLAKMREDGFERKILEVISDDTVVKRWPDQDVMSLACEGRVCSLPLNYIAYPYLLDRMAEPAFRSDYPRERLFDSILHPKIIHYAGCKPWNVAGVGYDENWWAIAEYLDLGLNRPKRIASNDYERLRRRLWRLRRRAVGLSVALGAVVTLEVVAMTLRLFRL